MSILKSLKDSFEKESYGRIPIDAACVTVLMTCQSDNAYFIMRKLYELLVVQLPKSKQNLINSELLCPCHNTMAPDYSIALHYGM